MSTRSSCCVRDRCRTSVRESKSLLGLPKPAARRSRRSSAMVDATDDRFSVWRSMGITTPIALGAGIVALFFGVFGAWATFAPLESAAVARGVISVETQRKTIQHLEGGIVGEIRVRDGDEVVADEVLVVLDDTQARAT